MHESCTWSTHTSQKRLKSAYMQYYGAHCNLQRDHTKLLLTSLYAAPCMTTLDQMHAMRQGKRLRCTLDTMYLVQISAGKCSEAQLCLLYPNQDQAYTNCGAVVPDLIIARVGWPSFTNLTPAVSSLAVWRQSPQTGVSACGQGGREFTCFGQPTSLIM